MYVQCVVFLVQRRLVWTAVIIAATLEYCFSGPVFLKLLSVMQYQDLRHLLSERPLIS